MERRTNLIHDKFMPTVPKATIKAWLFVHTKTVEKIQSSEANNAAKSVGAKRLRSSSNPVSVGLSSHRHSGTPVAGSRPNQFVAAIPNSSLAQSGVPRQRAQSFLSNSRQHHRAQQPQSMAPSISPQLSQRRQQAISSPNSQLSPQFNSQRIHQAHPNSPQSPQQFHPGTEVTA